MLASMTHLRLPLTKYVLRLAVMRPPTISTQLPPACVLGKRTARILEDGIGVLHDRVGKDVGGSAAARSPPPRALRSSLGLLYRLKELDFEALAYLSVRGYSSAVDCVPRER
jgi:hypothetical protein